VAKKRAKEQKMPPFVASPWEILNSEVLCCMSHSSRACLPYWLGKPKARFDSPEYYDTEFIFPYPEAQRYGFARATFAKIIRELIEKGFVDPKGKGGLRGDRLSYNRFTLSKRWKKYNTSEFQEVSWAMFQPGSKKKQVQKRKPTGSKKELVAAEDLFLDSKLNL